MRTIAQLGLKVFGCIALLSVASIASAQSISAPSVSTSKLCSGDSIRVSFTATGPFGHGNAFTLQLSDINGSFASSFTNIAAVKDTVGGTLSVAIPIPKTVSSSVGYRFRIISANPFVASSDNGSDILIGNIPPTPTVTADGATGVGERYSFGSNANSGNPALDSIFWDFGVDANPRTASGTVLSSGNPNTVYSSGGWKTITTRTQGAAGCSSPAKTSSLYVYDCTPPSISHDALIVSSDTTTRSGMVGKSIWVNPGVSLLMAGGSSDTIYLEPGSTLSGALQSSVIYVKPGAVVKDDQFIMFSSIIRAEGSSVAPDGLELFVYNCPTLNFDYSHAPPNKAVPFAGVRGELTTAAVRLSPNPTTGIVTIHGVGPNVRRVSVINVLGNSVQELSYPNGDGFQLDLAKLAAGTYFIRLETPTAVVTKRVVRKLSGNP